MPCPSTGWWVGATGRLAELFVDSATGPASSSSAGEPSTPALAERLAADGIVLADGARGRDLPRRSTAGSSEVAAGLARGAVLVIDYGHPAAELYGPTRAAGTLAGVQPATASTTTGRIARRPPGPDRPRRLHAPSTGRPRAAGLGHLGRRRQAEFLVGLGVGDLLEAIRSDPATTHRGVLAARSSARPDARSRGRWAASGSGLRTRPAPRRSGAARADVFRLRRLRRAERIGRLRHSPYCPRRRAEAHVWPTAGGRLAILLRALGASRPPAHPRPPRDARRARRSSATSRPTPDVEPSAGRMLEGGAARSR